MESEHDPVGKAHQCTGRLQSRVDVHVMFDWDFVGLVLTWNPPLVSGTRTQSPSASTALLRCVLMCLWRITSPAGPRSSRPDPALQIPPPDPFLLSFNGARCDQSRRSGSYSDRP